MNRDIFDKIMALPGLKRLEKPYKKHKEFLLYMFFGAGTTVVSIGTYWLFDGVLGVNELIANVISWIFAVTFAYITNRKWVFAHNARGAKNIISEIFKFFSARGFTLLLEEAILFIFVTLLKCNSLLVKSAAQVLVILLNYIFSKRVVFKNNKN